MADERVSVAASTVPATASMLVSQGDCSAQCLVSSETEATACACDCRGRHHGKLADILVPGTRRRPPKPKPAEPTLFDIALLEPAGVP